MNCVSESSLLMNLPWLLADEYASQLREGGGHHMDLALLPFKSALCIEWVNCAVAKATKLQGELNSLEIN